MDILSLPKPVLITKPDALIQMANQLANEPILAVDTESNSLFAFKEQVCLIQFSTSQDDFLVDPLALDDLSPLAGLFAAAMSSLSSGINSSCLDSTKNINPCLAGVFY